MSAVSAYLNQNQPPAGYEYIWQGGAGELRSKVRYLQLPSPEAILNELWNYDGSSTGQATTEASEVLLRPCRIYKDANRQTSDYYYVLCEALLPDGRTPAPGNTRTAFPSDTAASLGAWFGFEQEFFIEPMEGTAALNATEQGPFYCAVAATTHSKIRHYTEAIVGRARALGLGITGWNLEVAPCQTEIQVFGPAERACDDLTMLRYICHQTLIPYGQRPVFAPKPYPSLNGSGLHTNVSTTATRDPSGGLAAIHALMPRFAARHDAHIAAYGAGNEARLTGTHETSSIREFSYSVGGRHTSVRIPRSVAAAGHGYFEDRRPSAAADPYEIGTVILQTIAAA